MLNFTEKVMFPVNREITIEQAILMAQFQGYKIKSAAE